MGLPPQNNGNPAMLQLRRWDLSQLPFNLSEYSEGFISPTRELLLLHSRHRDATLLPLTGGCSYGINDKDSRRENVRSGSLPDSVPSTSGSLENAVSEPRSTVSGGAFSSESSVSKSSSSCFISDVQSLAWGTYGDANTHSREATFREFLFVTGSHGVTVHAFRQQNERSDDFSVSPSKDEYSDVRWVEWGPSSDPANIEVPKGPSNSRWIDEDRNLYGSGDERHDGFFRNRKSMKWLCSALTCVSNRKHEGALWTFFPTKSSFPCYAKVVSFHIFSNDSTFLSFLSGGNSAICEKAGKGKLCKPINGSCTSADRNIESSETVGMSQGFQCLKLFSSNSGNLVGFVLGLSNAASNADLSTANRGSNKIILVSRLDVSGLRWLCSVKLDYDKVDKTCEWADFQFSNNLLVCLSVSGIVSFYDALVGEYIACVNVLEVFALKSEVHLNEREHFSQTDGFEDEKGKHETFPSKSGGNVCKKDFQRLLISSDTSLLAVVDQHSAVYVICASDHLPQKYDSYQLLSSKIFNPGELFPWTVCDSDISCQRAILENYDKPYIGSKTISSVNDCDFYQPNAANNRYLQGKVHQNDSNWSRLAETPFEATKLICYSRYLREIHLPTTRASANGIICFSQLGITRITKKIVTDERKYLYISHTNLQIGTTTQDDGSFSSCQDLYSQHEREIHFEEAVGCIFHGSIYLVTTSGLSVFLPSVSVSSDLHPIESIAYPSAKSSPQTAHDVGELMKVKNRQQIIPPWKVEALDRVLLFECSDVADHFCLENGLALHASRLRRLQLALGYVILDAVEWSLEELASIDMAEEGILRLILAAVFMMSRGLNDNEVSAASRLLAVASHFATKMVRKYAILENEMNKLGAKMDMTESYELPRRPCTKLDQKAYQRRLHEMSHLLVIIRNLQCRLAAKFRRPVKGSVYDVELSDSQETNTAKGDSLLSLDTSSMEKLNRHELGSAKSDVSLISTEKAVLKRSESEDVVNLSNSDVEGTALVARSVPRKQILPAENPREMIERWKVDNMDLKNIVADALLSGRLPLAVLQLHLHRSKQSVNESDPNDTFNEVRSVGRAIAYDLFLKGEAGLAVATLQKLGEDVETCLRELLFGTVNRLLKKQITEEMKKYGYLRSYELALLDRISLIERIYPSSNFWRTCNLRRRERGDLKSADSLTRSSLQLLHPYSLRNLIIECGEIDGVVLGSWTHLDGIPIRSEEEDLSDAGYWASAAVWSNAWDQNTFDRILLDQPFVMGIHVMWESQFEYYLCHNDWEEISKLLDIIPSSMTPVHSIHIVLDGLRSSTYGGDLDYPDYGGYTCSPEELDAVYIDIPNVHIFQSSADSISSTWLRMLIDKELAKKFIFLKEYWDGTEDILSLMARSGFIAEKNKKAFQRESHYLLDLDFIDLDREFQRDTVQGIHKLVIHYCSQYNLPFLMDLYLDHHKLALDDESLNLLLDSARDCEWAKWLLLSRVKGHEYDASFCNARTIMSRGSGAADNISHVVANDIIQTVDDIAENGWLMASLATMMFASLPLQSCLTSGSVKRGFSSSAQCTVENLRPALQGFPTLWRMLVSVCLGNDTAYELWGPKVRTVGSSSLSIYLHWRDSIFYSCGHDSSLLQMMPSWFPRQLRRLIQLYVQGPLGWQATGDLSVGEVYVQRDIGYLINNGQCSEISALSWEVAIQKKIEQELFASSAEETDLGLEHHLLRGHALAAMNHLLGCRVQKLKSEYSGGSQSSAPSRAPLNIQMDVQTLFAPLTQSEESLLSVVHPLAISNYQNSMLVASCAFLLELCGLSAARLRVDTAALRRISNFYNLDEKVRLQKQVSCKDSMRLDCSEDGTIADSLAQALADNYLKHDKSSINRPEISRNYTGLKHPSHASLHVLHHLEKASLPELADGITYGSWLLSGDGDGSSIRSQQKAASQQWNLVTTFCQMHQLPLSTKYIALLARDNDWVGFLSEAQIGGYPFETVIHVAMREISDLRLRTHILAVLRAMQSKKKASVSPISNGLEDQTNMFIPSEGLAGSVELFGVLAQCEKQNQPGKALLDKAKQLQWSMLAIVASCFPDVSPLYCLTVWLEITAMRDASTVKADSIASQIAKSVGAAVEATNSLPAGDRVADVNYDRKRAKRQRFLNSILVNSASPSSDYVSGQVPKEGMKNMKFKEAYEAPYALDQWPVSLPKMLSMLCEQQQFLPLLRGFEMFIPSCSLLSFIRALQAFSQMRLSEASAHLGSFSSRIKEEPFLLISNSGLEGLVGASWICSTAKKAADAVLSNCPSPYEKRCLLQLLASTDFGDGGSLATYYRQQYWKINLAEPSLRKNENLQLGDETLDDASLLTALEKNGHWEQARNWARQLEASGGPWKFAVHHVTESQAESMVAEWKEFLWDVPEERVALWGHCQTLFIRYAFPALQAGLFFLKHAEAIEKDLPAEELHALLLLSLQWLSGMITQSSPVCPMHLLREIETRIWLLAVESEAQVKSERDINISGSSQDQMRVKSFSIIDRTATLITKMDAHINVFKHRTLEKTDLKENSSHIWDDGTSIGTGGLKSKRRAKVHGYAKRSTVGTVDKITDLEESSSPPGNLRSDLLDENMGTEISFSKWEERIGPAELERAVLSLLEFGQITASKQLQHKLSPDNVPLEFKLIDAALVLAELATPSHCVSTSLLNDDTLSVLQSYNLMMDDEADDDGNDDSDDDNFDAFQILQNLSALVPEGSGRGLCKRIIAAVKAANVLEISFSEAFEKKPTELLQLLSLRAQDSFEEARLLVQTHSMPTTSVAQILAESFLKGLLAAHRGGYIDSQKEEGPAPLLWRFSDFLKWAELCPSESEVGHALMRLVITGQEIPHACEVELLILSHHFYKSSACLDGVDVLVALAATRVDAYVSEGAFSCLARLVTGVGNFHALNFILCILIENGQLDLLLQKYSSATTAHAATVEAGFRMAVLTSLQHFNPNDLDAFAMVYNHFDMKHESAALLLSRAARSARMWLGFKHKNYTGYLLESMRYYIEAAEVFSSIDAGEKTRSSCAQASLVSLQIRMPDITWLDLPDTQARRALANQYQFQEALILAEAYNLNHPAEWVPVLWERMLKPEPIEYFVAEFVAVLPLHASMLLELAKFYKNEVLARRDQSQFSVWFAGGLPADWAKHLERAFRCLLNRTGDLRLRMQLAVQATGFSDIMDICNKEMDKVPETAGPLVLRKGHGGAYLPLM